MAPRTDPATLYAASQYQESRPTPDWIDMLGLDLELQEQMAAALMVPGNPVRLLTSDNKAGKCLSLRDAIESNQSYMAPISKAGKLHVLVFDLDSKGKGSGGRLRGVETARSDRDRLLDQLDTAGLEYVVCSSGSGFHVFVPLSEPVAVDDIAASCRALARDLASLDLAPILNGDQAHIRPPLSAHAKRSGVRSLPHVHPRRALEVLVAGNRRTAVIEWLQNETSKVEATEQKASEDGGSLTSKSDVYRHPERRRALGALKSEARDLAQCKEGGRARAAYRAGARGGHWVALGALCEDEVLSTLKRRPGSPPLEPDEADRQIRAGLSEGRENPRDWTVMPPRLAIRQERDEWAAALMNFVGNHRRSALHKVATAVIALITRPDGAGLFLNCALSVRDVAEVAGPSSSTTHRHLETIVQGGFLERTSKKRERLVDSSGRAIEAAATYRPTIPYGASETNATRPVIDTLGEMAAAQLAASGLDSARGLLSIPGGANKTLLLDVLDSTPRTIKEMQGLIQERLDGSESIPSRSTLSSLLASWKEFGVVVSGSRKAGYRWAEGVDAVVAYRKLMDRHEVNERHERQLAVLEHEREAFSRFLAGDPESSPERECRFV